MTASTALQSRRSNILQTRIHTENLAPLADGQIRGRIDNFALTANNITYGAIGDMVGYWNFYPTGEDDWGHVPVWGFFTVTESNCPDIAVGARFSGFLPMATHVTLKPARVGDHGFTDTTPHRTHLPPVYNGYRAEGKSDENSEALVNLFRPLFTTSFLIDDWLADNDFFGAQKIVLASASSKTALGAAFLLKARGMNVVGLTSARNKAFVESTGYYTEVLTYDELDRLQGAGPTVLVDMGGNGEVIGKVHTALGDDLKFSSVVGATHWDKMGPPAGLPGPKPTMFFAPDLIVKRNKDWGADGFNQRVAEATGTFLANVASWLNVRRASGVAAVEAAYNEMASGKGNPAEGHVVNL